MRVPARPLDGPPVAGWLGDYEAATAAAARNRTASFDNSIAAEDLDDAWRLLGDAMREWLSRRLGHEYERPEPRPFAHVRWRAERPRAAGASGEAESAEADAALLRCRRLRSFGHACGLGWLVRGTPRPASAGRASGSLPHPARLVLAALQRADGADPEWTSGWRRLEAQPEQELQLLLASAEQSLSRAAQQTREARRDAWHEWVDKALQDGGGRLYRWIRGGAVSAAAMVPDVAAAEEAGGSPGTKRWLLALRGGPAAQLRHLETHWRPLWQRATGPLPPDD